MPATPRPTVLTGIQPTGIPTLGNLLGFFKPALSFQATHQAYYFVVDHHAITVRQTPTELAANTLAVAAWYLAAGLNPAQACLFVQSHVPAHVELGWILTTFSQMGELERMTQFKDKSAQHEGKDTGINVGLFSYPVLQAADILLYHATEVPVGDDQKQHVELCRDIALRFNNHYGTATFTVPKHTLPPIGARVRDLQDPTKKMSKSRGGQGCVLLTDSTAEVEKKFKRAVTDSDSGPDAIRYEPAQKPGVANLLEIIAACRTTTPQAVASALQGQQYGALKAEAAEAVNHVLQPLQEAQAAWLQGNKLPEVLAAGAARANAIATPTLAAVKHAMGYLPGY